MQKPTLRLTVTFTLVSMILVATSLIAWFSYRNSSQTLLDTSAKLMEQASRQVAQKTLSYLALVSDTVSGLQASNAAGLLADDLGRIERLYFALMQDHRALSSLDYSDARGNFLMVKRMPDGALHSKLLRREGEQAHSSWKSRRPGAAVDQVESTTEQANDDYDPRTRPWYSGAMTGTGIYWSDVHAFYPNRKPEITASVALAGDDGQRQRVVGASVTLQGLSDFLASIDLGKGARLFVTDRTGRLIAYPDIGRWLQVSEGNIQLPLIGAMNLAEMNAFAAAAEVRRALSGGGSAQTLRLAVGDETWLGNLDALGGELQRDWFIGVLMPESTLLGRIQQGTRETLTLILLVLVLAQVIAMLVGRSITRPLVDIARETARIRHLDFSDGPERRSVFREINEVFSAYADLRIGLRTFGKYVPIRLVRQLLEQRRDVGLGGELRELTLFFSDIRSFSTTAESMPAAELAPWLGHYLGVMAEAVRNQGGTIDKFIGDGVMAFWNAPREDEDHAYQAVLTAFACLEAIGRLEDAERFYTRIGIHSGEVVVGNFGSPDRLNYTVIGDGVNLAARLEAVNKLYDTQILITRATLERLGGRIACRHIDRIAVKGKAEATDIYQPLGPTGAVSAADLDAARRYEAALEHYLAGDFAAAQEEFGKLLADRPGDTPARVMLERTRALLDDPPSAASWRGVYELHSK